MDIVDILSILCEILQLSQVKGPGQPPRPFLMLSKLLILHGEAESYCLVVSCILESMFNYL